MKIGVHLSTEVRDGDSPEKKISEILNQVAEAREAGLDMVGTGQHYLLEKQKVQTVPLLGRITAESGSMTVFTSILILPLHHPIEIAEQFSTLDLMAEDVVLGVGAGYRDVEFENFDIPKEERVGRLREGIEIINKLWEGDNVTYDGEYYSLKECSINPRPETKPDIWYGTSSLPAVKRAARISDAWYPIPQATRSRMKELKEAYDRIRLDANRGTEIPVMREAFVAPTSEEAYRTAKKYLLPKYRKYITREFDEQDDFGLSDLKSDDAFDEYCEERFLIGSPSEVCEEMDRYKSELDISHMVLRVHWPGMPYSRANECIRLIGDEVIPHV